MKQKLIISADDIGLSRANTDSIFQAVDHGELTSVSILANGEAVDYALEGYGLRSDRLRIALHANLTEGKALSSPELVPLLVSPDGMFRYSPIGLWVAYIFSNSYRRRAFVLQVEIELQSQWSRIRDALHKQNLSLVAIDGHQHVQMIPFVFDVMLNLKELKEIRITEEPFYTVPGGVWAHFTTHGIAHILFNMLAVRGRIRARTHGISASDYFLGLLHSGSMTFAVVEKGLSHISAISTRTSSVEILLHPGSATEGELVVWKKGRANIDWHYSLWRGRERALLMSREFSALIARYASTVHPVSLRSHSTMSRFFRFLVSGTIAATTTLLLLYIFTEWFHLWYVASATVAYGISVGVSFLLQKYWTFSDAVALVPHQFKIFVFMNIFNASVNALGVYFLVEWLQVWYMTAEFLVAGVLALWTFVFMRIVIFKNHPE